MAGVLNEAKDPSENQEVKTVLAEQKVRRIIRTQIKKILTEARNPTREDVVTLQATLNTLKPNSAKPDGIYGKETANAIAQFQKDANLTVDGVAGPETYAALASALEAEEWPSEDVMGALLTDGPIIGRKGVADLSPAEVEMPTINLVAGDKESDAAVADALRMIIGDTKVDVGITEEDRLAVARAMGQGDDAEIVKSSPEEVEVKVGGKQGLEPVIIKIHDRSGASLDIEEPTQLSDKFMSGDLMIKMP